MNIVYILNIYINENEYKKKYKKNKINIKTGK